jgi:hypothetical protein
MSCSLLTAQFAYISTIAGVSGAARACAPAKTLQQSALVEAASCAIELIHLVGREAVRAPPQTVHVIALPARTAEAHARLLVLTMVGHVCCAGISYQEQSKSMHVLATAASGP